MPATTARPGIGRALRVAVRPLAGLVLLAGLLWGVGVGPFLHGLRLIDAPAVAAALGIGALTTVCCAWRWRLVAGGLGVPLPLVGAVAQCYRAVFLNATLPGGVLGDVHRAVRSGRDAGDVGRGVRAVVWERTAGQVVQVALAAAVLLAFPSPVRPLLPVVLGLLAVVLLGAVLLARAAPSRAPARWLRPLRVAAADLRAGVLARRTWAGVVLASAVAVGGHLVTFLVAARTAGATAPLAELLPLTLLALLAMAVPANVGGFGPREGVAAWAFGAAGLSAAQGVATATVYGALVLVASLPGAVVLATRWRPRRGRGGQQARNGG
ncbi:flippase-like domain-containing protein [Micromonospora sp. PLK6-60]|uniref:lysylphosphatidylglycerol synthase domain-containing protein n=1 Tax=Micromonospora sp. PLK6-60 TaxID=2873383 RepID=UPI001CA6BBE7|nr:lysylphosphatidylglycerol synthase domain-containing protein [Micromonospora sp. PLK6-60]MBY8870421.1 flippase-like domain-containing protein [Micromonospora sp. PLK6-60]